MTDSQAAWGILQDFNLHRVVGKMRGRVSGFNRMVRKSIMIGSKGTRDQNCIYVILRLLVMWLPHIPIGIASIIVIR